MFLPGESWGRGSLVGCRLWGRTESDMTEATQQQQTTFSSLVAQGFPDGFPGGSAGLPAMQETGFDL